MGIGKTLITSIITGKTNLNTGIGGLTLNIIGNTSDYKFKVDKGIGNVTLNGKHYLMVVLLEMEIIIFI